jgi:two-component SAPR family response regulator
LIDSNGNKISNPDFPVNYINHIKDMVGKVDVIFVSTHQNVRQALRDNNISYILVYPAVDTKDEMLQRYVTRGSTPEFVDMMRANWDDFIEDMQQDETPDKIELQSNQYLSAVVQELLKTDNL